MWNKLTLRQRITLLSALVTFVSCGILTLFLVIQARNTIQAPFTLYNTDGIFISSTSSDLINKAKVSFTIKSIFFLTGIILIGILFSWFITRLALKPVSELAHVIERIEVNNLNQPIPVPKTDDEVSRLTQSFNQMLQKINSSYEGQKRFAQNAAHELKTPLSTILTTIEVMELDDEPTLEEYKEVMQITKENVERMSSLVKDLMMLNMDFKEPYTSFLFSELELFNGHLMKEIRDKNIGVSISGDISIYGNKTLIERAFINIIHNAIRYNYDNGKISIVCAKDQIIISDTGIGIPMHHIDKIFEPFYCVDISRSRKLGGSGLGLAIVKQIFEEHQIKVKVESIEKQGTKFIIFLNS